MTRSQAEIIESIAALPESDRRALVEHLVDAHLGGQSFLERMNPEQRQRLQEGIEQAERGDLIPGDEVFDRLADRRTR